MIAQVLRASLLAAALLPALAGCGSGDASTAGTGSQPTQTSGSAPADPAPDTQNDAALARAALVRLSDLPVGWTATPDDSKDFHCAAIDAAEAYPHAQSDRFDAPGGDTVVQHEAIVLADEGVADTALDALVAQKTLDCLARQGEETVREQAQAGTEVGHVTAARLNVSSAGDRTEGVRITYPVSANGIAAAVYEDLAFTRVDRGLSLFAFAAQNATPDPTLTDDLVGSGARRLHAALARSGN